MLYLLYFNVGVNLIVLGVEIAGRAMRSARIYFKIRSLKRARDMAKSLKVHHN